MPAALADDIQVYFNAQVNSPAVQANLETKIVDFINQSQHTLDVAVYDLDLPGIANAIVNAKQRGVAVRVITDNDNVGAENAEAYSILSDGGVAYIDDTADSSAGSGLQHNKLVVVDGRYVLAGSTNFTQSGIHGDLDSQGNLISDGNDNHILIIDSLELAAEVTTQMDLMWGDGPGGLSNSLFGLSKPDHALTTVYTTDDNIRIEVQFTPQSSSNYQGSGIDTTANFVSAGLTEIDIAQFVISAQDIADAAELPNNNGAIVRGIGDSSFFYRYYSEFQDMLKNVVLKDDGTEEVDSFTGAANNPWAQPADMRVASHLMGGDKWHHKYIRVDDKVLTGSHNASGAGSFTNDETILIIHDAQTAAEFKGHFDLAFCLSGSEQNCTGTTYQGGTWEGVTFTSEEVAAVLDIVNNASLEQLDIDAAMNKRAAENIISARPIDSMDQLEAVPYVGNAAMTDLYDYIPTWNAL
ncbi:phospholipase D-like domain-containing protein [Salinimonas marina]|uniref:phospholipase D-like domain-containing protein n=1 Tax=Salinimonas marina TaxID=2785918 RepID=UPI001E3E1048|nr:phospholipase D-like domain-containing protein [Salinimonas marina]